jgi:uncharacterized membrane protein YeaQ/YmgE (transglycosylase-associated protein family)
MEWLTLNPILCVGWIIVGALAGAVARTIMRRQDAPFIQDIILGLAGSAIGGLVAGFLGLGPGATADTAGIERLLINLVIAIIGAVILLFIGQAVLKR